MEHLTYLLKVSGGMIALYAVYWLVLRKHTYFSFNRFYLLAALLLSFGAPWVTFTEEVKIKSSTTPIYLDPELMTEVVPQAEPVISTEAVLLGLYVIGLLVMLGRLGYRLWHLSRLINEGYKQRIGGYILVKNTASDVSSFSFLNYLVIAENDSSAYADVILRHELVHIKQRHSWDLLLIEVVQALCWFNPILIYYKRSLKEIHEFIADELATEGDRFGYARRLASYALGVPPQVLTNNFFDVSQLKNRIAMLTKNRSSRWVLGRYLLAVPVAGVLISMVAARSVEVIEIKPDVVEISNQGMMTVKGTVVDARDGKGIPGASVILNGSQRGTSTDSKGAFVFSDIPTNAELLVEFIGFKTRVIPVAGKANTTKVMKIALYEGPNLKNMPVTKKEATLPPPPELLKNGDKVYSVVQQSPEFVGGMKALGPYIQANMRYPAPAKRAYVSGKVFISFVVLKDGSFTDIRVIKGIGFGCDEEALRLVKTMPAWKPGMQDGKPVNVRYNLPIHFELDKKSAQNETNDEANLRGKEVKIQWGHASNPNEEPLILLDGAPLKKGVEALNPDDIESIEVVKNDAAVRIYGAEAKNGVVRIISKKAAAKNDDKNLTLRLTEPSASNFLGLNTEALPYFLVDDKESSQEEVHKIGPNKIESVNVLKGEGAIKKYGDKGKNGVLEIKTKK
ncbi:MAG: TonB family protein [Runella zeae]